jgi:hypothetical protein
MTIGRRGFLVAGGAILGGDMLLAASAQAAAGGGRSVIDFGVEANSEADQSKALQNAIDEISASGEAVEIPGGTYQIAGVQLPARCTLVGAPGHTLLRGKAGQSCFVSSGGASLFISGLTFEEAALSGSASDAVLTQILVRGASGAGLALAGSKSVVVSFCTVERCAGPAIEIAAEGGAIVTGNHVSGCQTGISLKGSGNVSGNFITGAAKYGLRLGGGKSGAISAVNNTLRDCQIGMGVTADGETILASLNLITGARGGAIRAFDGEKLVGPDLARESPEAYLNLTLVGNVAR